MAVTIGSRLRRVWNAFRYRDENPEIMYSTDYGRGDSSRPDRGRINIGTERSIVSSIYNRMAIDVSSIPFAHARLDQNGRFFEVIQSSLHNCLTLSANIDQTGREFFRDAVLSMFDEGCVAIVPVDTTMNPTESGAYDVESLRTGKILEWYPYHVRVNLYNERSGRREDIVLPKNEVVIVENPLYSVMNEPNSTLKRLIYKLNILDAIDKQSGSGKLDIIIQLPYVIKTPAKKLQAEERRKDMEDQLSGSKYGIAYTDGTERVTQLNRPAENNLMGQIEFLTRMLYSQLGLTEGVFDGTADEKTMLNYHTRTIEPILSSFADGMKRTFLTKTARTQKQTIMYLRNPFSLVPVAELGKIADSFSRNAILSSNELRAVIGYGPNADPKADELSNKNINAANEPASKENTLNPEEVDPQISNDI